MTSPAVHRELGLTDDEFESIRVHLGREPTFTELAMFSVMWSEHCSYKSSRVHLENLPTSGPQILVGPGEGAGIVEVAPGVAVAWKIESHNHPSFVEPVNGAATGIGGIVRDILSMGARPIALMDSLRFGPLDDAHTRYLVDGVVNGISAYGNSIGVPTVGGETIFEHCYAENPLVNVACLGVVEHALMRGRADGPGNAVVLIGSSTGRDGIGGASVLASAEFDEASGDKRPSVQVGDPFTEKLLIEASLELIRRGLLVGFQDLGAGGISCPTSEMTAKSGTGMRIELDSVHRREPGMEPFEVMISESQERMLAVVEPRHLADVLAVCERWELTASVIGEVTDSDAVEVSSGGEVVASVEATALADEGPVYNRATERPGWIEELHAADPGAGAPESLAGALLDLLGAPDVCSKQWVWEQYDHMIFLGTVQGPGSDAAVIRLPDREEAVAISVDGPGRLCYLDPYRGAIAAVAEAARNVACTGAHPLALTNCLNFGNPEKPEVMWSFAEAVRGIGDAARALGTPVTGGNVSFYNETSGRPIYPTPVIGMLGALDSARRAIGLGWTADDDAVVLLGLTDPSHFAGSQYAKVLHGIVAGRPPEVDLDAERALIRLLVGNADLLHSAHDLADGGLGVALAEASIAGGRGFSIDLPAGLPHEVLFSESPTRAVVSCSVDSVDRLLERAVDLRLHATVLGRTGGDALDFGALSLPLKDGIARWSAAMPSALSDSISP